MLYKNLLASILWLLMLVSFSQAESPKKVLLLGQKRDHPPKSHEYMAGLHVLEKALQGIPGLETHVYNADEPWPEGPELLRDADAIVLSLGEASRWEQIDAKRYEALKALAARGGAIVGIHWAIGGKDAKYIPGHLALMGGCHGGPDRKYVMTETDVKVADRNHPILRGVGDMRLNDEFYYRLKFAKEGTVTPLLQAVIDGQPETVAWSFERPDGGRSFAFGCMHYHELWRRTDCRRLIVQGLLWTLKMPIPEEGVAVDVAEEDLQLK